MTAESPSPSGEPPRASSTAAAKSTPWCALFVASPSPGAIFRFLERRAGRLAARRAELEALELRVSGGAGPDAHRALITVAADPEPFGAWAAACAPDLAAAFPNAPALLFRIAPTAWSVERWTPGAAAPDRSEHPIPAGAPPAWQRLLGVAWTPAERAVADARTCAARLGLPAYVFPEGPRRAGARRHRTPAAAELDYAIVARLDQKGLLEESAPRLYRFAF